MAPQSLPRAVEQLPTSCSCRTVLTYVHIRHLFPKCEHLQTTAPCQGLLPNAWVTGFHPQRYVYRLLCSDSLPPQRLTEFHIILGFKQQKKSVMEITDDKPVTHFLSTIQFSVHANKVARLLCLDRTSQAFNLCDHHK